MGIGVCYNKGLKGYMMTLEELQTELWDFYKDVHGVRPRDWTTEEWNDIEFLNGQYAILNQTIANMTMEERIADGWNCYVFDPFVQAGTPCEQQRAPMDAETAARDAIMRQHYLESYGDL